jgi:hypothetical protein
MKWIKWPGRGELAFYFGMTLNLGESTSGMDREADGVRRIL